MSDVGLEKKLQMSDANPKSIYCTIFDSNYVARAIALYLSFIEVNDNGVFAFFCMDDEAAELVENLKPERSLIVRYSDFASGGLLEIEKFRSRGELCWTSKPIAMMYLMEFYPDAEWVIYVDTDMLFYSDPDAVLYGCTAHYLLTPHRFHPRFQSYERLAGRFNAGYMAARTSIYGYEVVRWWKERCLESCSSVPSGEKYADQKYLDSLGSLFPYGEESTCAGLNLAPWNIDNYRIFRENGRVRVGIDPLILYHFQGLQLFNDGSASLYIGARRIAKVHRELIYEPYMNALKRAYITIKNDDKDYNKGLMPKNKYMGSKVTQLARRFMGTSNLVPFRLPSL